MKKYSMRAIPAAAAMVAALVFGAQVQAQTNSTNPPGSTNPKDASIKPGVTPARAGADANNSSGNPVANSATQTPGTTNPKDNVSSGGAAARVAAPGMNEASPITPGTTGIAGTTKAKDVVTPKGATAKTAEERAAAKAERASAKAEKRAQGTSNKNTAGSTAPMGGGDMGSTKASPSK